MIDNSEIKYALQIGTVLKNPKKRGTLSYSIEPVMDGKPVDKHSRFRYKGSLSPVLGQGGSGITYLASSIVETGNISHKVYFAIKEYFVKGVCYRDVDDLTMKYSLAAKEDVEEGLKDFVTEATRLNKICVSNKNIVNVNEVFEANGTAYYVMEFLEGGNLRDKIKENGGGFSVDEALPYFLPISNAVSYIHSSHKLLHCDIKPDNIMLRVDEDGNEEPVLIDFGISLHFNSKGNLTSTYNTVGASDGYAPPEQYRGIDCFCPEVDVYALSATLFYLLTGHNPIQSFKISDSYIDTKLPQSVDNKVRIAIQKGMRKSQDERTHSISELVSSLSSFTNVGKEENIKEESRGRTRKFGTKKTKRISFADKLKNFFKPSEEIIKKENKGKENEKKAKKKPLTQSISLSRSSATLVTFINERSLLIYFRGNTYIYGGPASFEAGNLLDMPLGMYPQNKDLYEVNNPKLQRLSHSPVTLMEHIRRYDGIIERGKNYVLYRQLEEFVQLSELCFSTCPVIKAERLIHENQIIAFSQVRNETNGIVRVNIGDDFVGVEYEANIFSTEDLGTCDKSFNNNKFVKEISIDVDCILNYVVEGLSEYNKNLYEQGSVTLLQAFPYTIGWAKSETFSTGVREDDIVLTAPSSIIPLKKTVIIEGEQFDDYEVLSVYLLDSFVDSRQWLNLNVKAMLGYMPRSIVLTVDVDNRNFINFEIKDKDDKGGNAVISGIGDILKGMDENISVETKSIINND